MYEEDRHTAMTMYERMFDETSDEQGLLKLLVSPTRQAVVLARSYNAKERKLQIESRSQDENYSADHEDIPSFVFLIDKTAQQAAQLAPALPEISEDQLSIFDENAELPEFEAELEAQPEDSAPVESAEPVESESEETEDVSNVEETAEALDAFLADFSVENGELVSTKAEEEPVDDVPEEAEEDAPVEVPEEKAEVSYRTKTNVFLLVLYIFFAIPVGLIGLGVLLVPTVLFLALAAGCVYIGVSLIGMCFGSFAVIADTMVVFGAGLILVALSLLFVWLFIWFLGVVIVGFFRGICKLGRKLCCKEVAVQ